MIELDVDGHRSGVDAQGDLLISLGEVIHTSSHLSLQGVMTHAGESYACSSLDAIRDHARLERDSTVAAAERLIDKGLPSPVVSIGSTPTAMMVDDLTGITEFRPGVYTFFDLFQAGLGVARLDDIALSVLATVIGHQPEKSWVIVDAGWMAMSRDRGTEKQRVDQGYGVACDANGAPLEDVIMVGANQERGIIAARPGTPPLDLSSFPMGRQVRILPNHACATAGQYSSYTVIDDGAPLAQWSRINGWSA